MPSSGTSATKEFESSRNTPTISEQRATSLCISVGMISSLAVTEVSGKGGEDITIPPTQPPAASTGPVVVVQDSHDQVSPISELNGSNLVSVESTAMTSVLVTNPIVPAIVSLDSPVASEIREEDFLGLEGLGISIFEGAQLPGPNIRDLVGDLDKSWGNSKDWILQLRDGRKLVLPLSLYRSLDSMSVSSSLEGDCVTGNDSSTYEGQRVSWADECEGLVEYFPRLESELWEVGERLRSCEDGDEPLVVVPLATEGPTELESSHTKEIGYKESVDSCQLSHWVTNRIKTFKKSVGTSLEGFEEQITGLLLAIEAKKKDKKRREVGDQRKLVKSSQKGQRELKNLLTSLNVKYDTNKARSGSSE